jgi:hypothetical protein
VIPPDKLSSISVIKQKAIQEIGEGDKKFAFYTRKSESSRGNHKQRSGPFVISKLTLENQRENNRVKNVSNNTSTDTLYEEDIVTDSVVAANDAFVCEGHAENVCSTQKSP